MKAMDCCQKLSILAKIDEKYIKNKNELVYKILEFCNKDGVLT